MIQKTPMVSWQPGRHEIYPHEILQRFLREQLKKTDADFQREVYSSSGRIHMKNGSVRAAVNCFYKARDWEGILNCRLVCLLTEKFDGVSYTEVARNTLMKCPEEILLRHPVSMLRLCYALYAGCEFEEFDEGMTSHLKKSGIDSYMYDIETETQATMNALDGMTVYNPDVKKISVTPIAQMAARMMYSAGLTVSPKASMTEGEKLLKLLRLEHSADLPVDANIIKTATDYALQMCPSKEGMLAIRNCSNAMLATDGQTLKAIADIAALFMTGAATLVSEIAPFVPPILAGMLIGAGIALFVRIIGEIVNTFCPL